MNVITRTTLALLLVLGSLGAQAADTLEGLFADYDRAFLELNPHLATSRGDAHLDDVLEDGISPAYLAREAALATGSLRRLDAIDRASLTDAQRVSADTFRFNVQLLADQHASGVARKLSLMPISQFNGMHIDLAQLGSGSGIQPFASRADHERWLARAGQWPAWVDQAIANMRTGIAEGVVLPRVLVEKLLPQLVAHVVDTPEKSVFWGPVERIPAEARADLEPRYRTLVTDAIMPGYRKLHDFVREEYLPAARASIARGALPGGEAWYALDIRQHTTLARTAAEIHATGLAQVALLQAEMDGVRKALGFAGTLPVFYANLRTDPRWLYASEDAALEAYRGMKTRVRGELPKYFGRLPKADYEVRPVEAWRAASAAGGSYQRPDAAGKRPGVFYLNTFDLSRSPTFELVSLSLHEAEPGHHFQNALAIENAALPGFQRFGWVPAFGEGWALYAETIGRPMGLYEDPAQYLGFLHNRLFRAIRLVVDTGMHAKGWSREQSIRYFLDNSPTSEADATAETERYIAWPGQALAYLSGALEIERLRAQAERELGVRFDLRAFHDEVLGDGIVPMPVLTAKIERWIAARAKAG
jgi:uncharacterized protein (DUF885 family)